MSLSISSMYLEKLTTVLSLSDFSMRCAINLTLAFRRRGETAPVMLVM
jgi:hypothetical protein